MTTDKQNPIYMGKDYIINFNDEKYKYVYTAIAKMNETFEMDAVEIKPCYDPETDGDKDPDVAIDYIEFTLHKDGEVRIQLLWAAERSEGKKLAFVPNENVKTREMAIMGCLTAREANPMKKNKNKNNKKKGKRRN